MTRSIEIPDGPPEAQRAALLGLLDAFIAERLSLDLHGARLLQMVERMGVDAHQGAASPAELAERRGLPFSSARDLENLGLALRADAVVEEDVLARRMHVANAVVLGRVEREPGLRQADDRWLEWARTMTPRAFLHEFQKRRDEVRQGTATERLIAHVSSSVMTDFRRSRCLASRGAGSFLTFGQTVGVLVEEYLDDHDPLRTKPGTRRVPDTATTPDSRYVPAEAERAVRQRQWDMCAVDWCRNDTFLELSHRRSHCMGGSREADNIDLLCCRHHRLYESGLLVIEGSADAPVFKTIDGQVLSEKSCDGDLFAAAARRREAQEGGPPAAPDSRSAPPNGTGPPPPRA